MYIDFREREIGRDALICCSCNFLQWIRLGLSGSVINVLVWALTGDETCNLGIIEMML